LTHYRSIHIHIHVHIHVHVHIRIHLQVNFVVLDAEKPENAKLVGLFRVDAIPHFAFIRCCLSVCVRACVHTHISICTRKRPLSRRRYPPFCLDQARARSLSLCACVCTHTLAYAREKGPFRVDANPHLAMHIHIHKRIRTRSADRKLKTTLTGYIPPQAMAEVRGLV
jgi:hypothetical protein